MEITISIIGFGNIGKAICALLLPMSDHSFTINILDTNEDVKGAILDFQHGNQLFIRHKIVFNSSELLNSSGYIFHCAGASVPKGQSRLYTCNESILITEAVLTNFKPRDTPIFIIVSNPVEVIATITQKLTGLPTNSILGTGTLLDSMRMNYYTSNQFPALKAIDTILIGEHGSTAFFSKLLSKIDGKPADHYLNDNQLKSLMTEVIQSAATIKATQKATIYGVSYCAIRIFESILSEKECYLPVSTNIPEWLAKDLKTDSVYLSLYSKINKNGAVADFNYKPNTEEMQSLIKSVDSLLPCIPKRYL